jgi:hypothetical protein
MVDKFIEEHKGKGQELTFTEFRKYINEKYKNEIAKYPFLQIEMEDLGYEAGYGLTRLYNDVYMDLADNFDSDLELEDIQENLDEVYMHDWLIDIADYYKKVER